MYIDIDNISNEGYYFEKCLDINEDRLVEEDSRFLSEVETKINFYKRDKKILVRGNVRTSISLNCVRCLEIFNFKINSDFDIMLYPIEDISDFRSHISNEDMEYVFYEQEKIDVNEVILDQINLLIPLKPICRPNCKGICANCGISLNYDKCLCEKNDN
jgi:uncharacterized protein